MDDEDTAARLAAESANFWASRSIDELAAEQHVQPVTTLADLAMPDWPEDETADDVIAYVRSQREPDRTS